MGLIPTLIIAAAAAVLAVAAGWMGARAPNLAKGPRLVPWRFVMLLCATALMLMLVHLVNLAGVTTGR